MSKSAALQQARTANFSPRASRLLQRKCACGSHSVANGECAACTKIKSGLQRKLMVGASNDPLESEADRVAEQVLAAPLDSAVNSVPPRIQRFTGQSTGQTDAPASVNRVLSSSGRPLDHNLRQDMEQRFGHDFSGVRVHSDGAAEQSAQDLSAQAYTVGNNIVFGAGRFIPGTYEGRHLLAHELTHAIQQSEGRNAGENISQPKVLKAKERLVQCDGDLNEPTLDEMYVNELQKARQTGDWKKAAEKLNGFNYEDIQSRLAQLTPEEIELLHSGAVGNDIVGPDSQVAQLTRPGTPQASTIPVSSQRDVGLIAVLSALENDDWDVDSLAAELTDAQMAAISTSDRLHLISNIANGILVANEDEQTILRLLRTTPADQKAALVGGMGATLLQRLESVMDGEEYKQYHVLLRGVFFSGRSAAQATQEVESARTFPWANPGLIRSFWGGRFYYEIAEFTPAGRLRFVYWTYFSFMGTRNEAVEVDPMEMILVRFLDDETEAGAVRGQTFPMPAINLLSLVQKQFRGEVQLVADVALIGLGGAGVVGATTRLGRAIAALELAIGAANMVVREFHTQLAGSERGREFLAVWDIISTFIAIYGFTRLAIEGGRLFIRLRRVWQAIIGSTDDVARMGEQIGPLRQRVDAVLDQADEVRATQQGGTTGATPSLAEPAPSSGASPAPAVSTSSAGSTAPAPSGAAPTTGTAPPAPAVTGQAPTPTRTSAPQPRADARSVPLVVRARSGVDVTIDADQLEHVLRAHTIENFDPVARSVEIAAKNEAQLTTFFRRGTVTNYRELYTLIGQALKGSAGRLVKKGKNNEIMLTLRGDKMVAWVGSAPGGGMRLNSIYPLAMTGRNLTAAQIHAYAAEINAGTRTLDQIRAEISILLQLR